MASQIGGAGDVSPIGSTAGDAGRRWVSASATATLLPPRGADAGVGGRGTGGLEAGAGALVPATGGGGRGAGAVVRGAAVTDTGPPTAPPAAAGGCGISVSGGGGIGVCVNGSRASASSTGVWYRSSGFLAIILATTRAIGSGTSGRASRIGFGCRFRCQMSFWATVPSANGA